MIDAREVARMMIGSRRSALLAFVALMALTHAVYADDVEVELNNPGDAFKVTQGGVERLEAQGDGDLIINNSYGLPAADGIVGQVMATDGAGNVSWQATDNQVVDRFNLSGNVLELSLEDDNEPDRTVDLSSINPNTAVALASDGTDCPGGQYARGVDEGGNAQGCTAVGTQVGFGAWAPRSFNTSYLAATDGLVVAFCISNTTQTVDQALLVGKTDGSNPPATVRLIDNMIEQGGGGAAAAITMPVRKGDYWRVDRAAGDTDFSVSWLPLGS